MRSEAVVSPDAVSDAELILRAGRGEVRAFAEIYDRHAALLLALASRMLRSSGEAQDLVHDVLIEAWQAARDYDAEQSSLRTWLLIRLRSRALDRIGRGARYEAIRIALRPDASQRVREGADASERRIAVREALAELDADVRDALQLTYFEGLTSAEIAERAGVPVGTVKSRLARGLQRLHSVLASERGTEDDDG
jgi:RNA polymerase sigma-70 factor (ECF subfamily)